MAKKATKAGKKKAKKATKKVKAKKVNPAIVPAPSFEPEQFEEPGFDENPYIEDEDPDFEE